MMESLFDPGDMTQRDTPKGDRDQARIFVKAWNEKYPVYHTVVQSDLHDFGAYYGVRISSTLFNKGLSDFETFPKGIEEAATDLADELQLDY